MLVVEVSWQEKEATDSCHDAKHEVKKKASLMRVAAFFRSWRVRGYHTCRLA